jgi:hypothetical protein
MGIGAFRHVVALEHPSVVMDPPVWPCSIQSVSAQVSDGLAAFMLRGRFHPMIGLETQIVFEGRTLQVQGVTDLEERHREIQVLAVEVVARGTTPGGAPANVPPSIVEGPDGATIDEGESVTLTVQASGALPLFYQWIEDGADLPGMDDQFYVTGPLAASATYAVRVSNAYGSVLSAPAIVTIDVVTYQEQVIADGASAYWPLDDPSGTTARDLMGTYDGTIVGGVTLAQPGVAGSTAMSFDGTTGYVQLPALPALAPAMSIEAWFNTRDLPAGTVLRYLADIVPNNVIEYLATRSPSQYMEFSTYKQGGGTIGTNTGAPSLTLATWYHVVITADGTTVVAYLNGVNKGQIAGGVLGGADSWKIGSPQQAPDATFKRWDGWIQDFAIYPRALTPTEIAAHYHLRVPAPAFPPGLVSYWSFDSGWNDQVGTNHLTNVNGVTAVPGKLGNAGDFESSSSQYLSFTEASPLGDEDFTYCCWFKSENPVGTQQLIAKDHETGRSYFLQPTYAESLIKFVFGNDAVQAASTLAADTAWHFVIAWHDAVANTINLQLDGGTTASNPTVGVFPALNPAIPVRIGARQYTAFEGYFDGLIDEVGLWRRVLTAQERSDLWNGGAGLPRVP